LVAPDAGQLVTGAAVDEAGVGGARPHVALVELVLERRGARARTGPIVEVVEPVRRRGQVPAVGARGGRAADDLALGGGLGGVELDGCRERVGVASSVGDLDADGLRAVAGRNLERPPRGAVVEVVERAG